MTWKQGKKLSIRTYAKVLQGVKKSYCIYFQNHKPFKLNKKKLPFATFNNLKGKYFVFIMLALRQYFDKFRSLTKKIYKKGWFLNKDMTLCDLHRI